MSNSSLLKTALIAMGFCAFATPAFSSTVLQFGKGGATNGTVNSTTGVGAMDVGLLTVNVDGNSSQYTFSSAGFLHFDFTAIGTDAFALKTTGGTTSLPSTAVTTAGTGAPGAGSLQNLGATAPLITATTNLNNVQTSANPANYTMGGTVWLLNSFLADLGIASGSSFAVSGGFSGLTSTSLSSDTVTFTLNPVPEPSSAMLFGTGLLGLACLVWKRKKAQA